MTDKEELSRGDALAKVAALETELAELKEHQWPASTDVGRFGDMSQFAHLRVGLDGDNDVYVSVYDDKGGASIEFCVPGSGGRCIATHPRSIDRGNGRNGAG
tara:strand:- start:1452 stop:1757 length:306 start_codon:yes stop_codon:yes gene_type:complete